MRTPLFTLSIVILTTFTAKAEVTVKDYKASIASSDSLDATIMRQYVRGLGEGIRWTSALIRNQGQSGFFCEPEHPSLTLENYIDILNAQIRTVTAQMTPEKVDRLWIGMLLAQGLRETFPCKGDKRRLPR